MGMLLLLLMWMVKRVRLIEQNWGASATDVIDLAITSNGSYFLDKKSRSYSTIGWLRKPGNEFNISSLRGDWSVRIFYNGRLTFTPTWEVDRNGTFEECINNSCTPGEWDQFGSQIFFTIPGLVDFHGLVNSRNDDRMEGALFNSFLGEGTWEARRN